MLPERLLRLWDRLSFRLGVFVNPSLRLCPKCKITADHHRDYATQNGVCHDCFSSTLGTENLPPVEPMTPDPGKWKS